MALKKTGGMEMKGKLCAGTFFRMSYHHMQYITKCLMH